MYDFDEIIRRLREGELPWRYVNFCYSGNCAYLMGEGAEQCWANKEFDSKEEVIEFYLSLGVTRILPI